MLQPPVEPPPLVEHDPAVVKPSQPISELYDGPVDRLSCVPPAAVKSGSDAGNSTLRLWQSPNAPWSPESPTRLHPMPTMLLKMSCWVLRMLALQGKCRPEPSAHDHDVLITRATLSE